MNIEIPKINKPQEINTEPSEERKKIVEEVFRLYHDNLLRWCIFKLNAAKSSGRFISHNVYSDAEEILALVYEKLLTSKKSINLTRGEADIRGYLNIALKQAIDYYIRTSNYQKRRPKGGFVSYEEILSKRPEQDISHNLKQYFGKSPKEKEQEEEMHNKIEQALVALKKENEKMADIITKRYQQGKKFKEIGDYYGESRSAIEQLEKKALRKIRKFVKFGVI